MTIRNVSSGHTSAFKVVLLESTQMQQLPVSQLMRVCPTSVVLESTYLREAAEILVTNDLSVLVVASDTGKMLGVVTENAVIRQLMSVSARDQTISQIVSRHAESVRMDAELNSVLHLFRSSCHGIVPVVDEMDSVVGFLYRRDVVSFLLSEGDAGVNVKPGKDGISKPHFMNRKATRADSKSEPPNTAE